MASSNIRWTGDGVIRRNIDLYGKDAKKAIEDGLNYFAPLIETDAKVNAIWTDRTGAARSGLFTTVEVGQGWARLYLSGRMYYQIFLEKRWAGKYAIILPTLQSYEMQVMRFFHRVFRR